MSTATDRRDYSETAEHVTGSRHGLAQGLARLDHREGVAVPVTPM